MNITNLAPAGDTLADLREKNTALRAENVRLAEDVTRLREKNKMLQYIADIALESRTEIEEERRAIEAECVKRKTMYHRMIDVLRFHVNNYVCEKKAVPEQADQNV